jgi:hypothetical protein
MASGFGFQGLSSEAAASVAEGPMKACCTKRKAEVDAATGGVEVPSEGRTSKRREGEPAPGEKHADAVVAGAGGDGEGTLAANVNEQLPGDSTSGDSTSTVSDSSTSDDSTSTSSDSSMKKDNYSQPVSVLITQPCIYVYTRVAALATGSTLHRGRAQRA